MHMLDIDMLDMDMLNMDMHIDMSMFMFHVHVCSRTTYHVPCPCVSTYHVPCAMCHVSCAVPRACAERSSFSLAVGS